ncbi:MAG TPA: ATP-binding protein [Candidatus Acidoferrales bacterium]|nr:ATP-binding protein [Candidatus Acidoferrales bacterium]
MSDPAPVRDTTHLIPELRKIIAFRDLSEDDMTWLVQHMEEVQFRAGEVYGRPGDPLEHLFVLLEGEVQGERPGMPGTPTFTATAGDITGLLPFSRLTHFKHISRAVLPTRGVRLHKRDFPEMLHRIPVLAQRLVALMSDRIREYTRMETQQDKLMALGKLSAGLAHELNNPAAAARRASQDLMKAMDRVRAASMKLMQHAPAEPQRNAILQFERAAGETAIARAIPADPLERSDCEEAVTSWLEEHNIDEPWEIASTLADGGVTSEKLDELLGIVGTTIIGPAVHRVAAIITIYGLIQEIDNSTRRISELVTAVKRYSYMDQAPMQEVDLHDDLENTLKIFGHRLKKGVNVVREYDPQLPRVCAFGSELNQVWTNLIDNAIDAMQGQGELRIRTCRELDSVVVEICDNGPGVPQEIQSRIFDPFFTTKGVGEGTGLGLDTASRIVRKHHGYIELKSAPGDTRFRVRLPIEQPKAQGQLAEEPS